MIRVGGFVEIFGVTCVTRCGCTGISIGMTLDAVNGDMGSGQRKLGVVMIKRIISAARGVTSQTGSVCIGVAHYSIMLIICSGILMAGDTSKLCIIIGILMTVRTIIPLSIVLPAIDGKILVIMLPVAGRCPSGIRGVAIHTRC